MIKSIEPVPIFIHGILRRSGTNYLNEIILRDPICEQPSSHIRENWFLHHGELLFQYSELLLKIYSNPKWGGDTFPRENLLLNIGNSLIDLLQSHLSDPNKILVTKTPSVQNMKYLDLLFPGIKNIIIVRNPLDIAASTYNTWKVNVDKTIADWNRGCMDIFEYENKINSNYILIRYEDLIMDFKRAFTPCIEFLGLNHNAFDWSEIERLPVFGSGDNKGEWKVVEKDKSFQAIGKWKKLPKDQINLLKQSYQPQYAKYFGYTWHEEKPFLSSMPNLENRLKYGRDLPSKLRKGKNDRFKDFKNGIKLVFKSITNNYDYY